MQIKPNRAVLSCGAVYYDVQGGYNLNVNENVEYDHLNESLRSSTPLRCCLLCCIRLSSNFRFRSLPWWK